MKNTNKSILSFIMAFVFFLSVLPGIHRNVNAAESYLWPVPGFVNITNGYSDSHKAIDIASSGISGSNVVSTKSDTILHWWNVC